MTKQNKKAFTLAEVLITLGIIGVVAAMTMPTLIQNHQKQSYVTGLKKGMSVIENMLRKMVADEDVAELSKTKLFTQGIASNWATEGFEDGYGSPSVIAELVPKYLKVVKTCVGSECNIPYQSIYYESNGAIEFEPSGWGYSTMPWGYSTTAQGFYTSDGMIYYIMPYSPGEAHLLVFLDVNGEKGPNIIGRDTFCLKYDSRGKRFCFKK